MIPFEWETPQSLDRAIALLASGDELVRPISGGTALMLMMKAGVFTPSRLVSLSKIEPEHSRIELEPDGSLHIGALASLSQLERSPTAMKEYPVMRSALRTLSNIRVRNAARVGGALAHGDPHMDLPPLLAMVGAVVWTNGPDGARTMPVEELYTGYYQTVLRQGELIVAVVVPPLSGAKCAYAKVTSRSADDWPAINLGIRLEMQDERIRNARVVVSAATEKVTRLTQTEQVLAGARPDDKLLAEAVEVAAGEVSFLSDAHGSAAYKKELLRVYLRRTVREALS